MGFWAQSPESSRLGPDDYTSFSYAGTATLELDDNPSDGITGSVLWDQMSFEEQRDVRYVALCRGGGGHHRDNLIIDAVNLQVRVSSGLHFSRTPLPNPWRRSPLDLMRRLGAASATAAESAGEELASVCVWKVFVADGIYCCPRRDQQQRFPSGAGTAATIESSTCVICAAPEPVRVFQRPAHRLEEGEGRTV